MSRKEEHHTHWMRIRNRTIKRGGQVKELSKRRGALWVFMTFIKNQFLQPDNYATHRRFWYCYRPVTCLVDWFLIWYIWLRYFFCCALFIHAVLPYLGRWPALASMAILAISSNIVIHWHGRCPLSIVRYRTAVKDPADCSTFLGNYQGLRWKAGMYVLAVVTFIVILLMLIVLAACKRLVRCISLWFTMMVSTQVTKLFKNLVALSTLSSLKPCEKTVLRWLLKSFCENNDLTFVETLNLSKGVSKTLRWSNTTANTMASKREKVSW